MKPVNGAQFFNITPLFPSSIAFFYIPADASPPIIVIAPYTSRYASLQSHQIDFNILVSNLIWLFALYIPRESSFILTQFFVLKLDGKFGVIAKKIIIC